MGICEKSCERYLESASRAWNAEPAQLGRRAACERDTLTGVTIVRPCPSNSQVKKAGSTVRKFMRGEISDYDRVNVALDVIYDFRAAHQLPMTKANNGLRSMIRTEGAQIEVSQRLKRFATIIDKLEREPTLALNSMQDIGGVRAVLADIDEVRRVEARLRRNRTPIGQATTSPTRGLRAIGGSTWLWSTTGGPSRSNSGPVSCTSGPSRWNGSQPAWGRTSNRTETTRFRVSWRSSPRQWPSRRRVERCLRLFSLR